MRKRPHLVSTLGLALGLVLAACGPGEVESPRVKFAGDVEECSARLREIHRGLTALKAERGWTPSADAKIPGDLVTSGFWTDAARIACPGGAYAGRDLAAFPLERFPTNGSEVLMACANDGAPNHASGEVNVLYADGSVVTLVPKHEIEAGRLPAGTANIPVGPGSPIPDLAKLAR